VNGAKHSPRIHRPVFNEATGTLRKENPCGTKEACSEERAEAQAWDSLAEMDWLPWDDSAGLVAAAYIPLALVVIGFVFTAEQDRRQQQIEDQRAEQAQKIENQRAEAERELAEQRAQDEALQAYLGQMNTLLLEKDLRASEEDSEVRTLARARTLTVLGGLDVTRRTSVVQFLVEASLIQAVGEKKPVISLEGANLEGIHAGTGVNLHGANLRDADLSSANLANTNLSDADLSSANLIKANLSDADLRDVDLRSANLGGANLNSADLIEVNLNDADLSGTDMTVANLHAADLSFANLTSVNLSYADLSYADLSGANVFDVDLSGADLIGADLSGAQGVTDDLLAEAGTMPYQEMPAGDYVSYEFEPALLFRVGEGWRLSTPETPDELPLQGPGLGQLTFITTPLLVFNPSNPGSPEEVPAPENAEEWASWFQSHPHLDTSEPVQASVGGAPGVRIDVTDTSVPDNFPGLDYCLFSCVPLFPYGNGNVVAFDPQYKDRFVIVDVEGETVVIDVAAPVEQFDEFLPKAQKVLDTVEWTERSE